MILIIEWTLYQSLVIHSVSRSFSRYLIVLSRETWRVSQLWEDYIDPGWDKQSLIRCTIKRINTQKNTFCSSPLSRALLLHASTSPIVLSRQNPSISSFADHLCPLLPNSLHRPYVPVYIEDIVTAPTARQMSGDQTGLLIYFLTFPSKSIFYDTETKHIHV